MKFGNQGLDLEPLRTMDVPPFSWRDPLAKFVAGFGDPTGISIQMLGSEITEEMFDRYKALRQRESELTEEEDREYTTLAEKIIASAKYMLKTIELLNKKVL